MWECLNAVPLKTCNCGFGTMARCPVDTHTFTLVTDIDNIDFNLNLDNIDLDRSLARPISMIPDELAITTHVRITSHEANIMFHVDSDVGTPFHQSV